MSSAPAGDSAFASSLTTAARKTALLTWLEDELCTERKVVELALEDRHQAMFKEMARRLEAVAAGKVQWRSGIPSYTLTSIEANPGIERIRVAETPLKMPHWQRQDTPPAEPSSPSSSFLIDEEVRCAPSSDGLAGTETVTTPDVDEHIVQTPALDDEQNKASLTSGVHRTSTSSNKKWKGGKKALRYGKSVLEAETASPWYRWLMRMVLSDEFETVFAVLIVLNTLALAVEAQYHGIENGFQLVFHAYLRSAENVWPGMAMVFNMLEWFFGLAFTFQVMISMFCLKTGFFCDAWNMIDTCIVMAWLLSVVISAIDPVLLRLARMVRLLRLLQIVHTVQLFDKLYLMTTAIKSSVSTLIWAIMVLLLLLMMMGLLLQKLVEPFVLDNSNPEDKRRQVFMFYGTFGRSMLTMFEISLGNWMPPCRALVENVSEWYMFLFVAHKLVIGFSVVSVINAVIVQETFKVATSDDRIMLMVKERSSKMNMSKIQDLFEHVDEDKDSHLSLHELLHSFADPEVQHYVSAFGLDAHNVVHLFTMLDSDNDGLVSFAELSDGMLRLRGTATSYDVQHLLRNVEDLNTQIVDLSRKLPSDTSCTTKAPA